MIRDAVQILNSVDLSSKSSAYDIDENSSSTYACGLRWNIGDLSFLSSE
jgi:hypothetical protein